MHILSNGRKEDKTVRIKHDFKNLIELLGIIILKRGEWKVLCILFLCRTQVSYIKNSYITIIYIEMKLILYNISSAIFIFIFQ